ncbi:hypothetical protein [Enterobacter roggenkampii]|uniref:hypothetical protein n=1 Tax=Enterobacter roggenkampii TaxID=1812935 RepID=UPI0021CACC5A|nr:hypothetical protein [Enterobacter roggenkampii]ELT0931639.1 hypothetical protein [Enterobacter roggenkampii]MCU3128848.1 hypothetical protein [Enterobacter roggenkampii]
MSTITRERLLIIQQWRETYGPGSNVVLPADEAEELARIALASLEAKSRKLFTCSGCSAEGLDEPLESKCHCNEDGAHWVESVVYTAPPAPVSVPDRSMFEKWWESEHGSPLDSWDSLRTTDGYCDDGIDGQFEAWNACRAAMLQGAENAGSPTTMKTAPALDSSPKIAESTSGNSPVIPDGWVMVPVEPTEKMVIEGFESEPDEFFSKSEEWEAYQEMSGCEQAAHRAKLCWSAMLAAAPKPEA